MEISISDTKSVEKNKKPKAFIFAGANASGKSTFISFLLENNIINGEYINPDLILKNELNLNESPKNYLKAFKIAKKRRKKALEEKKNIIIETTFSSQHWIDFCETLQQKGYYITFVFTATNSPYINSFYLMKRVKEGGHEVPLKTLLKRREKGFKNLKKVIELTDCLILLDNSMVGEPPIIVKGLFKNRLCFNPKIDRKIEWLDRLDIDFNLPIIEEENELVQLCTFIQEKMGLFLTTLQKSYEEKNAILQEFSMFEQKVEPLKKNKSAKRIKP